MGMNDRFLTVRQVAEMLGICTRGVWRLVAHGEMSRPVKVRGAARFVDSELAAYVDRLKRERGQ